MERDNDIKAIIPDESITQQQSNNESYVQSRDIINSVTKKPHKRAAVKSRVWGALAAAIVLVVGAGGVMTYMGAVKNTGPLADLIGSSESAPQRTDKEVREANTNAKYVFVQVDGSIADLIADGGRLKDVTVGTYSFSVDGAEDLFGGYLTSEMWKQLFPQGGEVAFEIGAEDYKVKWAQWRQDSTGFTGQYPYCSDGSYEIEFGRFNRPDSVSNEDYAEKAARHELAMTRANTINNCAEDYALHLAANGSTELKPGDSITVDLGLGAPADIVEYINERGGSELSKIDGKAMIWFGQDLKVKYVCYQTGDGQYTEDWLYGTGETGEAEFGKLPEAAAKIINSGNGNYHSISQRTRRGVTDFDGYTNHNVEYMGEETDFTDEAIFGDVYEAYCEGKLEEAEPTGAQTYGIGLEADIFDPTMMRIVKLATSDRTDADVIIDGKYYTFGDDLVGRLTKSDRNFMNDQWINVTTDAFPYSFFMEDFSAAEHWYDRFKELGLTPLSPDELGERVDEPEFASVSFIKDGRYVEIASTVYEYANVQVDGQYYHVDDTAVLNAARNICSDKF